VRAILRNAVSGAPRSPGSRVLLQNHLELMPDGLKDQLSVSRGSCMVMIHIRCRLLWHGMFLFFLGLCTGLIEQRFSNPRMGLLLTSKGS
jgi:hypothetical protein